jgi:hypothetical protein
MKPLTTAATPRVLDGLIPGKPRRKAWRSIGRATHQTRIDRQSEVASHWPHHAAAAVRRAYEVIE